MKNIKICSFLILGIFLIACAKQEDPEKKVRKFAENFVEFIYDNDLDSIRYYYPDIRRADSIATIADDDIYVSKLSKDEFEVEITPEITIVVEMDDNGDFLVTESYGLFAFPEDKVEFAKKTGMWDTSISDIEMNRRIKDEGFVEYIRKTKTVNTSDIISIGKLAEPVELFGIMDTYQPLTNLTDIPIDGKDYSVRTEYEWQGPATEWDDGYSHGFGSESGMDIAPNGTIRFPMEIGFRGYTKIIDIRWNLTPEQLQEKFAPFTGNEYSEYLEYKN